MKNVLVLGVAALALVGCGKKEEAPVAPAATEAAAPADASAPTPADAVKETKLDGAAAKVDQP